VVTFGRDHWHVFDARGRQLDAHCPDPER
jgi:hypothetical protein